MIRIFRVPHGKPTLSLSHHGVGQFPLPTPRSCNRLSQSNHNLVWFCRLTRTKREPSAIFRFFAAQRRVVVARSDERHTILQVPCQPVPDRQKIVQVVVIAMKKNLQGPQESWHAMISGSYNPLLSFGFSRVVGLAQPRLTKIVTVFSFLNDNAHLKVTKIVTD